MLDGQVSLGNSNSWVPEPRIANPPPFLLIKYTRKEKAFFEDYAQFVLKVIQDQAVTDRIGRILALENVRVNGPIDIRVMVFPARTFRGQANRVLHGSYNSTASQISLYPLRIPKEWIRNGGFDIFRRPFQDLTAREKNLLAEISTSAISTLLHETFHVKLGSRGMSRYVEESVVRKMETQHMRGWDETISIATERALG